MAANDNDSDDHGDVNDDDAREGGGLDDQATDDAIDDALDDAVTPAAPSGANDAPHWLVTADADRSTLTPVMQQLYDVKRSHPDAIIFFRLGDFYELFFEDALEVAPLLDMVLTSRNKRDARPIPMCGFPYFAIEAQVQRLLGLGRRIAVVEQLEDPRMVRGIVKRGVTRVITPGVVLEPEALEADRANHIVALSDGGGGGFGVAVADVSTGDLRTIDVPHAAALDALLVRLEAREILAPDLLLARLDAVPAVREALCTARRPEPQPKRTAATDHAVATLRAYLAEVRPGVLGLLGRPQPLDAVPHLRLERETVIHLELLRSAHAGRVEGSLFGTVNRTQTAAGARHLRALLLAPLADRAAITTRHDAVEALYGNDAARAALAAGLHGAADLARVAGRLCAGLVTPRALAGARETLDRLPALHRALKSAALRSARVAQLCATLAAGGEVATLLGQSLADEPRNQLSEGGVIRPGRCADLDALVRFAQDGEAWVAAFADRLRSETGIAQLKVRHNRNSGWGIEIARSRGQLVPDGLRRVQTLKHVERFSCDELAEFEQRLNSADADRLHRERELYEELCSELAGRADVFRQIGAALGELDAHCGFALIAIERGYVRAELSDGPTIELFAARHPVVEASLPQGAFVANDVALDGAGTRVLLLTGPNMAGKSTLMRQVALACILSQAGAFVPATSARLPILDSVMTRIGASDDISGGASTFMVEMRETAAILARATGRSLLLLDEVGRGTSTQDGLAIARAVIEHLHNRTGALVLFATHYQELTDLDRSLGHLANAHVAVREIGDDVVFIHRLAPGATSRSHGISVARLAGLPDSVLRRARALLAEIPAQLHNAPTKQLALFEQPTAIVSAPAVGADDRGRVDDDPVDALAQAIADLDVDDLSPRQAHQQLYRLRAQAMAALGKQSHPDAADPDAAGAAASPPLPDHGRQA